MPTQTLSKRQLESQMLRNMAELARTELEMKPKQMLAYVRGGGKLNLERVHQVLEVFTHVLSAPPLKATDDRVLNSTAMLEQLRKMERQGTITTTNDFFALQSNILRQARN